MCEESYDEYVIVKEGSVRRRQNAITLPVSLMPEAKRSSLIARTKNRGGLGNRSHFTLYCVRPQVPGG